MLTRSYFENGSLIALGLIGLDFEMRHLKISRAKKTRVIAWYLQIIYKKGFLVPINYEKGPHIAPMKIAATRTR